MPLTGGLRYAAEFFWDASILLLIPAVFAVMRESRWRAGAVWVVAMVAYIVSVGGDPFSHYRLIPVLPVLAVSCGTIPGAGLTNLVVDTP